MILTVSATLPLLLVSATAPLLQGWFALTPHPRANDPYFLYAASNAGSLLALLAYPIAIEPALGLREQSRVWRSGFLLLGVLAVICGATAFKLSRFAAIGNGGDRSTGQKVSVRPAALVQWIVLVFIPSSWLLGVTTYLTTDLAAIPLLWVIPLAIYLVSFILAFARSGARAVRIVSGFLPYLVALLALVTSAGFPHVIWIPLHLAAFFAGSVACHARTGPGPAGGRAGQCVLCRDRRRWSSGRHFHGSRRTGGVQPGRRVPAGGDLRLNGGGPVGRGASETRLSSLAASCCFRQRCFC